MLTWPYSQHIASRCTGSPERIWRCPEPRCATRTWTETSEVIRARSVLTERARVQACQWVGQDATDVAAVAAELGVGWATVMRAVVEYGTQLLDAAARGRLVRMLGVDETAFLKATATSPTRFATGWSTCDRRAAVRRGCSTSLKAAPVGF